MKDSVARLVTALIALRNGVGFLVLLVFSITLWCGSCASPVPSVAELESASPGKEAIGLTNPTAENEIEGFASAPSVNRGDDIRLFVSTPDPSYTIEILRMGWYKGVGSRSMMAPLTLPGTIQDAPFVDPVTSLVEATWRNPYTLHIPNSNPADWPSGVYVARLTAGISRKQSYIIFVVRDDFRPSALLFQVSVNTYEAYNDWGGFSLYSKPPAYKVSFNRPYRRGHGTGDFLFWEYSMVRFLEREGYDVTYTTDVDMHNRGDLVFRHKAVLVVGHDEYWSWQLRDNFEAARDGGIGLGFFGSNIGFWQVRYEPSPITGEPDRTMTCYKKPDLDPLSKSPDPKIRRLTTVQFRQAPVNRPEDALIGVMFETGGVAGDIVVEDSSHWIFAGTGLQKGDHLPGLLGYEVDGMLGNAPAHTVRVAHSPYEARHDGYSDMTAYETSAGSAVVATGSMQWNWGLTDFEMKGEHYESTAAQQATRNILSRFGASPILTAISR